MGVSQRTGSFLSCASVIRALLLCACSTYVVWYVANHDGYNLSALYSGALGLLSIFVGFLATFYVFVVTRSNRFLEAIQGTASMRQLLLLVRTTLKWSMVAVALTFAIMVAEPRKFPLWGRDFWLIAVWCLNLSVVCVNFWRSVKIFFRIVDTPH